MTTIKEALEKDPIDIGLNILEYINAALVKPESFKELLDLATDVLYSRPHGERLFTYDDVTNFLRRLEMKRVFIKVVDGNHQECIDYLVSIGGEFIPVSPSSNKVPTQWIVLFVSVFLFGIAVGCFVCKCCN